MSLDFRLDRRFVWVWLGLFCLIALSLAIRWTHGSFGRVNFDEIALVLHIGMDGVDAGLLHQFINKVFVRAFLFSGILAVLCQILARYKFVTRLCFVGVFIALGIRMSVSNIQLGSFFQSDTTDFYEREYVAPTDAEIVFPKNPKNVLVIALESIEKSYANPDLFGVGGMTPNITKLETENVSFGRYEVLSGLTHTIAAITGMTTGLPLFFTSYKKVEKMLGAVGIGQIFLDNGYQTWSFFPASGQFSLKENFLHRMGFEHVYDGVRFKNMLTYPLDVAPFGGVDDATLFELVRPMISDIVKSDKPYFIFMETVNTHCDGYFTQACRDMGFKQETMSDIFQCEDYIVADFVKWFRAQDPNAVVILIDDHELHSGDEILSKVDALDTRPLANVFINTGDVFSGADTNRPIAAFDFFPTIIEATGAEITGCKLGLGTSVTTRCGNVPTLREKYGDTELERLLEARNDLYYRLATGKE